MAIATSSTELAESLEGLEGSRAPVLIFEVATDALGVGAGARGRAAVRSLGTMRMNGSRGGKPVPVDGEVTAVLVLRSLTSGRLLSCIRALARGGEHMPPELMRQLMPAPGAEVGGRRELDRREHEVLCLIADGCTTAEIAQELNYSERTVKNVVHDLLEKLNCRTRAQAVGLAARQGAI